MIKGGKKYDSLSHLLLSELFTETSRLDQKIFHIPGISAEIMRIILDYAYTNYLAITGDNAQELLLAANLLCASEAVQVCCVFIESQMSPKNCIGIWRYTTAICPQPVLHFNIYCYILQHFEDVALGDEFLLLSLGELTDIIETDNLIVKQESTVYEAIWRWTSHAPQERETHFPALFSKVQ